MVKKLETTKRDQEQVLWTRQDRKGQHFLSHYLLSKYNFTYCSLLLIKPYFRNGKVAL